MFPSGLDLGVGARAQLIGNLAGPCPMCGGDGTIPDGFWEAYSDTELLRGASHEELQVIRAALLDLRAGRLDADAAAAKIEGAGGIGKRIAERLRSQKTRMEMYAVAALLVAITGRVWPTKAPAPNINVNIEQVVTQAIDDCNGAAVQPPPAEPRR